MCSMDSVEKKQYVEVSLKKNICGLKMWLKTANGFKHAFFFYQLIKLMLG